SLVGQSANQRGVFLASSLPMAYFDLQGHRGARGLKPENTLPAFEAALDAGVTTIETDVHLTQDGVPIIHHDAQASPRLCELLPGNSSPDLSQRPAISTLTLAELRHLRACCNPDPRRFPQQDASVPPLAQLFADQQGMDPYTPPTLREFLAFA